MSDTAVMTLTEFLTARLDEDEAVGRAARKAWALASAEYLAHPPSGITPARVLAEVGAKRRILEMATYISGTRLEPVAPGRYNNIPVREVALWPRS